MSVLIKGLEMPRHCTECLFCKRSYDEARNYVDFICIVDGTISSCPLIPIPDHGDLIDRDELKHGFCVECTLYPDNCLGENCDWDSIYHIEHAPAVIPAEGSEE